MYYLGVLGLLPIIGGAVLHSLALFTAPTGFALSGLSLDGWNLMVSSDECLYYESLMSIAFLLAAVAVLAILVQCYRAYTYHGCEKYQSVGTLSKLSMLCLTVVIYLQGSATTQSRLLDTCQGVEFDEHTLVFAAGITTLIGIVLFADSGHCLYYQLGIKNKGYSGTIMFKTRV